MYMKHTSKKRISLLLCMMLIVAMALVTTGCGKDDTENQYIPGEISPGVYEDLASVGEGKTQFDLMIVDLEGNDTILEINTDKETLGEALLEYGIISGEDSEYGLYVKTVNGITADYDVDQTYWALYIEGDYATTGVDTTKIEAGKTYSLEISK